MNTEDIIKENEELRKLVLKAQGLINSNVEIIKELKLNNVKKDKEIMKLKTKVEIYEKFIKTEKKLFNKVKDVVIDKESETRADRIINDSLKAWDKRIDFKRSFREKVNEMLEMEVFNLKGVGYEKKRK